MRCNKLAKNFSLWFVFVLCVTQLTYKIHNLQHIGIKRYFREFSIAHSMDWKVYWKWTLQNNEATFTCRWQWRGWHFWLMNICAFLQIIDFVTVTSSKENLTEKKIIIICLCVFIFFYCTNRNVRNIYLVLRPLLIEVKCET